jgi:hypothetical protein
MNWTLTPGQHGAYWVLSESERAKGFIRPVRLPTDTSVLPDQNSLSWT